MRISSSLQYVTWQIAFNYSPMSFVESLGLRPAKRDTVSSRR